MIIGLGGACIERYLFRLLPDAVIETAELDPDVVKVARKWFNYVDDGKRQIIHIGDGRKILERSTDKYDLLMLDAFSATSIPYALSTKEFLEICKAHLTEGGIVAGPVTIAANASAIGTLNIGAGAGNPRVAPPHAHRAEPRIRCWLLAGTTTLTGARTYTGATNVNPGSIAHWSLKPSRDC